MSKTLALLIRALRTESRDIKSHMFRAGLASLVVLILYMGHNLQSEVTAPGMMLFKWMTIANWVFVTISGATIFAVSISEETEHETLGLLRMANIGPLSLLLGKWLPRVLTAFVLISVQFPFTWLTVTLGGVSWEQIWACYLLLLAHLVLVGNVGLLASVLKPTSVQACSLAVFIILIARLLPFLGLAILQIGAVRGWCDQSRVAWFGQEVVFPLNKCTASGRLFNEILMTSFRGSVWTSQVVSNLALGAGLFCISWLIFDRVTMRHIGGGPAKKPLLTRFMSRTSRSSSTVWNWALGWKDFHQVAGGLKAASIKLFFYGVIFAAVVYASTLSNSSVREGIKMAGWTLTMLIFWFLLPLEICLLGGKLFRPEIQNQTWSTLLTLPQSLSQLVYSKLGGAVLGLIPTVTVLCVSLIPNLADMTRGLSQGSGFSLGPLLVIAYFYSAVILAAHLSAYFSVVLNWAVPLIAVVCGAGVSYLGNLLVLIMFMIASVGFSFGGDAVGYILMAAVILGNLGLAGVVHAAIGQQLVAKGAQS